MFIPAASLVEAMNSINVVSSLNAIVDDWKIKVSFDYGLLSELSINHI